MIQTGAVYTNPVTGEYCVVRQGTDHKGDGRLLVDLHVQPGGAVAGEHVHPSLVERFEVIAGTVGFRKAGVEAVASPGERVEVLPGVAHDWWNAGDDEAHVLVEVEGALVERFEQLIVTIFGLAHDGKVDAKGMPDLVQLAVIADAFGDVIVFTKPPRAVQRALFGVLAPIGRRRGRRAVYPHHRQTVITAPGAASPPAT
jgi:quercetin dioxygenase-like cupin family protein